MQLASKGCLLLLVTVSPPDHYFASSVGSRSAWDHCLIGDILFWLSCYAHFFRWLRSWFIASESWGTRDGRWKPWKRKECQPCEYQLSATHSKPPDAMETKRNSSWIVWLSTVCCVAHIRWGSQAATTIVRLTNMPREQQQQEQRSEWCKLQQCNHSRITNYFSCTLPFFASPVDPCTPPPHHPPHPRGIVLLHMCLTSLIAAHFFIVHVSRVWSLSHSRDHAQVLVWVWVLWSWQGCTGVVTACRLSFWPCSFAVR